MGDARQPRLRSTRKWDSPNTWSWVVSATYRARRNSRPTIGRAADNDVVMVDGRVSRHHARLTGRRGTLVYLDLGSTNGSRVNGVSVEELVLGEGDRIEIGDTVIVVEVVRDGT